MVEARRKLGALEFFMLGVVSKLCATLATNPLVTVKIKLSSQKPDDPNPYTGAMDCIKRTIQGGGFGALYAGIRAKIVQTCIASGILFMSKEQMMTYAVALVKALQGGGKALQ